ncbi:very short patch repair endonuclease [Micromonospora sp. NPDC003776]
MRANKARDTGPERRVRSLLHKMGLRYRVNARPLADLRRTADVVFPAARLAVFIDGCYWHGCAEHYRPARANDRFWSDKIAGNRARDAETNGLLAEAGWTVIRIWEHEDPVEAVKRVATAVRAAASNRRAHSERSDPSS